MRPDRLWAPHAWVGGRWEADVLLCVGADGCWQSIEKHIPKPAADATALNGPVLPGLVNAHSHAFQRAFVGFAERRDSDADDFWSWRDRMYRVALRITPDQLRTVATQLYTDLLRGGYTQVCEFHYLQHRPDGVPYDDPLAMSWALADAAADAGIGLTMLPVLYERAGFSQPALRDDQRRFASTAASVWQACRDLQQSGRPLLDAGVAIHSLRAASIASMHALQGLCDGMDDGPIHLHVAEQTQEVADCLAATGRRPIELLCDELDLDARWQLVHATHATPSEIDAVARSGASVVLCPSTEGNLGDGLADLRGWLDAGVAFSIGSDSHVTRAWPEELRWLEYGQRLHHRQRNVAAAPALGQPATAERLFAETLAAGGRAAGFTRWGLQPGARADLLVLDANDNALLGLPVDHTLDALVFSSPGCAIREVFVAGRRVIADRRHARQDTIGNDFGATMHALHAPRTT